MAEALFGTDGFTVRELVRAELPALQALFEANPGYFVRVGGQPPRPDEAVQEFDEQVPPHLSWSQRWFAGVFDDAGGLRGLFIIVSDLSAPGVWHIALFILEDALHGSGLAARLHAAYEAWARAAGARWLRLAVIDGNVPAERFWPKCGYREVRRRPYVNASGAEVSARVLVKPLGDETLLGYLAQVPRDAPDSPLP